MKKLLYNISRTKIFNLDQVVCIQRIFSDDGKKGILLHFPDSTRFLIVPGGEHLTRMEKWCWDNVQSSMNNRYDIDENHEMNKKLYEYFEHKFTKSPLCRQVVKK